MKKIWESKTFWVAVIGIVAAWLTQLDVLLSSEGTVTVMGVLMILLRVITKDAVSLEV